MFVEVLVGVVDLLVGHPGGARRRKRKHGTRHKELTSASSRRNDSNEANDRRPNALDLNPTARRRLDETTDQSRSVQTTKTGNQSETCYGIARAGVRNE